MQPNPPTRHLRLRIFSRRDRDRPLFSPKTAELAGLFDEYLHVRYAARSVESYRGHLRVFLTWLEERGVQVASARIADLDAYSAHLFAIRKPDGKPYAVGLIAHRLTTVRTFFRFLYRRNHLLHDPAAMLEMPREEQRLPRVILTPAEAHRILNAPDTTTPTGLRDRAILETLYGTGIRVGELIDLGVDSVDTEERVLRILLGKGGKDRVVPLTRVAAEAIEAYLVHGRPKLVTRRAKPNLFLGGYGFVLHRACVSRIIKTWARRAKVKKDISAHTFRHSIATHLLRRRADIRHIQALLGHESLSTTQRYTRVEVADLRRVLARAHPRGK